MNGPTPRRLWNYVTRRLRLRSYFQDPGDGRRQPQIPAGALLWALLLGQLLRRSSFHAVEALARSSARVRLAIRVPFGDDTLRYFAARLDTQRLRQALAAVLRRAKRNKAFDPGRRIGLAVDGTGAGWRTRQGCTLCRPKHNPEKQILGYQHHLVMISVVGTGLTLPCDVEPYGPGDSEYAAGGRLLRRAVANLGKRFAQYVVVDGGLATGPFLHTAGDRGLRIVARLKENLPELFTAAQQRFLSQPPKVVFGYGKDRVEVWDAGDFDPWMALRWETVRVLFYRQHKPDGTVVQAYWLTDFPAAEVGSQSLFHMAKSRWEIENQGFNEAKSHHDLEHIRHHHANSLVIAWLVALLALTIERLYRLRYLHRGRHRVPSSAQLLLTLWLNLSRPCAANSS